MHLPAMVAFARRQALASRFADRAEAGRALAERLERYRRAPGTVVLGLPRGGVVPAAEVARELELPLDVIISHKLGAPGNPELAIGAVAEGGEPFFYDETIEATGASDDYIAGEIADQWRAIATRQRLFRGGQPLALPDNATVILVDDGIATGSTVIAAIHALRARKVRRLVLATPAAPTDTARRLGEMVDELVAIQVTPWFSGVSQFYDDFRQVTDDEVRDLLAHAARNPDTTRAVTAAGADGADRAVAPQRTRERIDREVEIGNAHIALGGHLTIPAGARGIVVFAHGSGSSRHSPRNRAVADFLQRGRLATLLVDLLTQKEASVDQHTAEHRFNIDLLADRVGIATRWLRSHPETSGLATGYFGASTGAAAALVAAASDPEIHAVVSRGGRPDLAGDALEAVQAPTLLVVGGDDTEVLQLNRGALARLRCMKRLEIVEGATHLFEEPGTLEEVSRLAREWFVRYLR